MKRHGGEVVVIVVWVVLCRRWQDAAKTQSLAGGTGGQDETNTLVAIARKGAPVSFCLWWTRRTGRCVLYLLCEGQLMSAGPLQYVLLCL